MKRIEIPLSRKKIYTLFLLALAFTSLAILLFLYPNKFTSIIMKNIGFIRLVGMLGTLFFGLCSVYLLIKIRDRKPGLIIDDVGIIDNTNATSIGLIKWGDITSIEERHILNNKFLIIHIDNPEVYLRKAKNLVSKSAMAMNLKKYGSPLSIISSSLTIDFEQLSEILSAALAKSRKTFS